MNKKEANKYFPLWRVDFSEFVYGKDSGNSWDDPENDIRKKGVIEYYSQNDIDSEWKKEYEELFGDYDFAMHKAPLTLQKLKEVSSPPKETVMFEYHDRMFTFDHWFDNQKCVCGEAIDEFYNEYEDDSTVKVDIVQSYVFFYEKDCLVIKNGSLYMNGKLLITRTELFEKHGISKYQSEIMHPNHVQKKIKELFPQAKSYSSWCAGGNL
jgi:hypothetical protein